MGVGIIGIIIRIFIDNVIEKMPGEAGREIKEKFIVQRVMRTERVVTKKLAKAAHGFGAEASLDMWFATGILVKSAG